MVLHPLVLNDRLAERAALPHVVQRAFDRKGALANRHVTRDEALVLELLHLLLEAATNRPDGIGHGHSGVDER